MLATTTYRFVEANCKLTKWVWVAPAGTRNDISGNLHQQRTQLSIYAIVRYVNVLKHRQRLFSGEDLLLCWINKYLVFFFVFIRWYGRAVVSCRTKQTGIWMYVYINMYTSNANSVFTFATFNEIRLLANQFNLPSEILDGKPWTLTKLKLNFDNTESTMLANWKWMSTFLLAQ